MGARTSRPVSRAMREAHRAHLLAKRPNQTSLCRRAVLRGLGGVGISLPFLELFADRAHAQTPSPPKRYVVAFAGSSIGMDNRDFVRPSSTGPLAGNLSRGLSPLADLGVENDVSVVSDMVLPWDAGSGIPAGGRMVEWHSSTPCPLLSGMRSAGDGDESLQGQTSDWYVADAIGGPTLTTRPVLTYRVQAAFYRGTNGTGGTRGLMSARYNGDSLEDVPPQFSPQVAFQDLFTGFIPANPADAAAAKALLNRRKSVIDLVSSDTERLLPKLGAADKIRMERHFDELRKLENKLTAQSPPDIAACELLPDPGADPPIGGAVEDGDAGGFAGHGAWSDEERRADVMVDLIHMAFACDLSRVSALMFSYAQCFLNMYPVFGYTTDLHELGHYGAGGADEGAQAMADGVAWHVKHFARLVQKLRDTEDIDGSRILDHTAMVLLFEGGWGEDPEQRTDGSPHSSQNMCALIGGHAGSLNASGGRHISAPGEHPTKVVTTAMSALGLPAQLGEVSGTIDGLIG